MVPRQPCENGVPAAFLDELGRLLRVAADDDIRRPATLHRAAASLAAYFGADLASLVTPTDGEALRVVASSDPETVGDVVTSVERYPELHRVLADNTPALIASDSGDSIVAVPIRLPDIVGVLRLASCHRSFDQGDVDRLLAVTAHLERTLAGDNLDVPARGPWSMLATALADAVLEVAFDGRITAVHAGTGRALKLPQGLVGSSISALLSHADGDPPPAVLALELGELMPPATLDVMVQLPRAEPLAALATMVRTDRLPPRSLIALTATPTAAGGSAVATGEREARLQTHLEQTLADLERSQLRLAEVESTRHRFVSASAHELKTPITVARSYLEIILNDLREGLTEEQLSFVRIAHESVLRLRRLVGDLVDLAALDSGRIQLDIGRVAVDPLLDVVLDEQRTLAERAGIALARGPGQPGLALRASADRVEQVLRNLIDNALKFTPSGGTVTVLATSHDDSIALAVRDTGIGIAADAVGTIFGEFVQADSPGDMKRRGAGLGLAIARRIARALGGRITVESQPGTGSSFTIWLPRWPDDE